MWDGRDAWLLQAIVYAGRRGRVSRIIAQADALNVAIPTREELEASTRRLEAAGLVEANADRVRATRNGRRLVRRSGRWRDGIRSITPRVEEALKQAVAFPSQPSSWTLSESDWRRACDDYAA